MRSVPPDLARKLVGAADRFATGFDDVRMDDIAQVSGIPRATLYYYFAGKNEILAFLLDALLADFTSRVAGVVGADTDAQTRLTEFCTIQLDLMAASPATAQLLIVNLGKVGKLPDIATAIDDAFLSPIARLLEDGVGRGDLADVDIPVTAMALFGAVTMTGLRAVLLQGDLESDRLAAQLVDLYWNGIGRRPAGQPR
jgi:TetR/AcrR family transcriptional regulator